MLSPGNNSAGAHSSITVQYAPIKKKLMTVKSNCKSDDGHPLTHSMPNGVQVKFHSEQLTFVSIPRTLTFIFMIDLDLNRINNHINE